MIVVVAMLFAMTGSARAAGGLIYIESGHGGSDSGTSHFGVNEKTVNLGIALKLNALLRANGYPTVMSRYDDATEGSPNPWEDIHMNQANAMGADIFLSIHNNASETPSAYGTETHYSPKSPADINFANLVQTNMVQAIRSYGYYTDNRILRPHYLNEEGGPWMICRGNMPAVLVETLFVSNPTEAMMLNNPFWQQVIAQGLFNAIVAIVPPANPIQFPRFQWDAVAGAANYEIELLTSMPAPEEIMGTGHSRYGIGWAPTVNEFYQGDTRGLKAGTYYWRVIARDGAGNLIGLYTTAQPFEVPKPLIGQPFNGQPLQTQYPNFIWSSIQSANSYGIELLNAPPEASEANGTTASVHRIGVGVTNRTSWRGDISGLKPGTYYYRIISWNGAGWVGGFSDTDSVIVPKPTITNPIGGATLSSQFPRFTWSPVAGATSYGLELLNGLPEPVEQNGNTASVHGVGASATSNAYWAGDTRGLGAGTYYYRVIAGNAAGLLGGFSDTDSFVMPKPLINPIDWSGGENLPYFSWNQVIGATDYGIELLNAPPENPNGAAASRNRIGAASTNKNTFFQGDISSLPSGTYYARVIAWNDSGLLGGFSDTVQFAVSQKINVTSSGDAFYIMNQSGGVLATVPAGGTAGVSYTGGTYRVTSSTGYSTVTASYIRLVPASTNAIMRVMNMPQYNRFRGVIEIRYSSVSSRLWAINELDMNSYMNGMGEEPETWPGGAGEPVSDAVRYQEFLKLSAVAFRSYAYDVSVKKNKHSGEPFDLCNSPASCQWYIGYERETYGGNLASAVAATSGQVVAVGGVPVRTPYFSDCGGWTISAADRGWNYPFCLSVNDTDVCSGHTLRGHGVGICMNGARWRAASGWDFVSILDHYLAIDSGLGNIGNPTVRVGVFSISP